MAVLPPPVAKISRPVTKGCLPRTRLHRLIDRSLKKNSLLWVCGPPGCGKTILVSTYVGTRKVPALWYKFDEGDGDIASFFYHLGLAGKTAVPRKRKPLPVLTPEYMQGIPGFTRQFFENLFSRLSPDPALVFDDYQEVSPKSLLHELIATGLSRIPEGATVIIVSRSDPPPAYARFQANNQMDVLGWDDLRLTLPECKEIVRFQRIKRPTVEEIRHLHDTTDGWAAGLVLMLGRIDARGVAPQLLSNRTPREIFDYFGSEIFERTGRSLRDFLVKTAFLPDMTAREAEKLTGQRRAAQLLSYLSSSNYFLVEHTHTEPVYQYHSLFREFLLYRAKDVLKEKDARTLKQLAAELLEESGRAEDAADLFRDIGDHESLTRLILANASSLLAQGRNRVLQDWLGHIPEKTLMDDPWLLFWLGACQMPYDPVGSMGRMERSFDLFWKGEDPAGTYLSWSLIMDNLCMHMHDFGAMDEWIDRFERIAERFPSFPSREIETRVVASLLGGLYMRRVDHPDVEAWVNRAWALVRDCNDITVRLQMLLYLFLYYIWNGDFHHARGIIESTRQWTIPSAAYPQRRILFHLFEARLHARVAQFDDSIRSVSKGLDIAETSGIHLWDFLLLAEATSSYLGKGDLDSASANLQRMALLLGPEQTLHQAYFHHFSSWRAALQGDIPLALSLEETAHAFMTDCGAPCGIALGYEYMARLENEIGKTEEAEDHLERAEQIARGMKSSLLEYQLFLVKADIAFLRGDGKSGRVFLAKALSIGREKGYFHYENWVPSFMIRLCVKALKEGIEVSHVQEIIRKRNLVPDSPPLDVEAWPWPVKVSTLGRFGILRDGKPLTFSRKVQKRPLSLLKALIAFGGRGVREEQVADTVWPEAEGDMAIQSMSVALRRLRQLLGHDEAVHRREGVLGLDPRYCWVDAFVFERLLGEAASLEERGLSEDALKLMEKALALYRGPFLVEDAERTWAVSMRERLRSKYLRIVGRLGDHWQRAGRWEKARECYRRGLDVDDLAEEFYQSLISCYLVHGRRAEALAVYDRLKKTFASLGVEPSPKTRDLLVSLRST